MRVLLDNCTPRGIVSCLRGHFVKECRSQGWDKLENGDLLDAAEAAGFEVFVTSDKNIPHQQNLTRRKIAVIELDAVAWPLIRPHLARIRAAVEAAEPGSVTNLPLVDE
jgi:hypothetical protein